MLLLLLVAINAQKCLNQNEFAILRSKEVATGEYTFDFEILEKNQGWSLEVGL
jgi:hypothetical protein